MNYSTYIYRYIILSLLLTLVGICNSYALSFLPSDIEWMTWTDYCRARYVVSDAGRNSKFTQMISPNSVKSKKASFGKAWYALHHYCAGRIYLQRGLSATNSEEKKHMMEMVIGEIGFTLQRTPPDHFLNAEMTATLSQAYRYLGDFKKASSILSEAISRHPQYVTLYVSMAIILRANKELNASILFMQEAQAILKNTTSEFHYIFGILLHEAKKYDESLIQAKKAYEMGYPLPGLRKKLERTGHWKKS